MTEGQISDRFRKDPWEPFVTMAHNAVNEGNLSPTLAPDPHTHTCTHFRVAPWLGPSDSPAVTFCNFNGTPMTSARTGMRTSGRPFNSSPRQSSLPHSCHLAIPLHINPQTQTQTWYDG